MDPSELSVMVMGSEPTERSDARGGTSDGMAELPGTTGELLCGIPPQAVRNKKREKTHVHAAMLPPVVVSEMLGPD
jgi:hypothetical protein